MGYLLRFQLVIEREAEQLFFVHAANWQISCIPLLWVFSCVIRALVERQIVRYRQNAAVGEMSGQLTALIVTPT